jgi:hypothetical protein
MDDSSHLFQPLGLTSEPSPTRRPFPEGSALPSSLRVVCLAAQKGVQRNSIFELIVMDSQRLEASVDALFGFLPPSPIMQRPVSVHMHRTTYLEFAQAAFHDKSPSAHIHTRARITRPLLEGDFSAHETDAAVDVWASILAYLGSIIAHIVVFE